MNEILFQYVPVAPTSWAYLASLLILAVYFKFSRVWSMRNLDLMGLISLAPALLLVKFGHDHAMSDPHAKVVEHAGYIWLFAVSGPAMLRLLLDALMVRRPLLEPNLTVGGLTFLGISLFVFLMANVITGKPEAADLADAERAARLHGLVASKIEKSTLKTHGPGFPLVYLLPHISTHSLLGDDGDERNADANNGAETIETNQGDSASDPNRSTTHEEAPPVAAPAEASAPAASESRHGATVNAPTSATQVAQTPDAATGAPNADGGEVNQEESDEAIFVERSNARATESSRRVQVVTARVVAILSQLAIVLGIVLVGLRHFDNIKTGIAGATLYLLLPYTSMWTGSVTHALPGALLVWAVVFYRWPYLAGMMIGLAFGTIYYPVFLLPLWISFYWRRGAVRFLIGVLVSLAILITALAFTSSDVTMFLANLRQMFGVRFPVGDRLAGVWQFWNPVYRYPILAAFTGLSLSLVLWPAQKNLGTLIAYSAAVMLGTQFWHAHSGGLALAWYLPLLLLTVFRPNLEDRVALAVVR